MRKNTLKAGFFVACLLGSLWSISAQTELRILSDMGTRFADVNDLGHAITPSQYYDFETDALTPMEAEAAELSALNNKGDVAGLYIYDPAEYSFQAGYKISGGTWQGAGWVGTGSDDEDFTTYDFSSDGKYIVGQVGINSLQYVGFFYDVENDEMSGVFDPQGQAVALYTVNENGIAAGWVDRPGATGTNRTPAYRTPDGELHLFPEGNLPESGTSSVAKINDSDIMVGDYYDQPFMYDPETEEFTTFTAPGGAFSATFTGLSNTGVAVGFADTDFQVREAIIYDPNRFGDQPVFIKDVLADMGIEVNTIDNSLGTAYKISPDGKYIVGWLNGPPMFAEGWILYLDDEDDEPGSNPEDCDQGHESNDFESGNQVGIDSGMGAADDFLVSAGSTLNIKTIKLNIMAYDPVASIDLKFYEDDNGMPGNEYITLEGLTPDTDHQVLVGNAFGMNVFSIYLNVDVNFEGGDSGATYWMHPIVTAGGVVGSIFWETTTAPGGIGHPMLYHQLGEWGVEENKNAVFTLYCETTSPEEQPEIDCLTFSEEVLPITQVVFEEINNTSDATAEEPVEDFTDLTATIAQNIAYPINIEGVTQTESTNFFTAFIDLSEEDQEPWTNFQSFQIGEIYDSNGTDGVQLNGTLSLPEDFPDGTYTMRILSIIGDYAIVPCGTYAKGQAEDYTLIVDHTLSVETSEFSNFTFFPNPVIDQLNIQAGTPIETITLFNLLGQQVMDIQPETTNAQMDLNQLSTGVYLMKVNLKGVEKTYKVIKE